MNSGPTSTSEEFAERSAVADADEPAIDNGETTDALPREADGIVARRTKTTAFYQPPVNEDDASGEENDDASTPAPSDAAPPDTSTSDAMEVELARSDIGGGSTPPPDEPALAIPDPSPVPEEPREEGLDFFEHLGELRQRILYCVAATAVALCLTWNFGKQLTDWFTAPIREELKRHAAPGIDNTLITIDPTEAFVVYFQITLVAALLLVMPFILFQLWRFIEPALTRQERRYGLVIVPFAVALFFTGAALGYFMSPVFFRFFLAFQPAGVPANLGYGKSAALLAKMLLVFGVCFEVPVVTILLHKIGLVSRNLLIEYWRHVVIVIFTIVAVITPTWDPFTLVVCALPPCVLYAVSIWLVKWL